MHSTSSRRRGASASPARKSIAFAAALALLALPLAIRAAPPGAPGGLEEQVRAAVGQKRYRRAIRLLKRLIAQQETPERVKQLAEVYSWSGRNRAAIRWYRKYLKLRPKDDKAHLQLGLVLSWSKRRADHLEALRIFDHHIAWNPQRVELRLRRARVRYWIGHRNAAIADYRAYLAKRPDDAKAQVELGAVLTELSDLSEVKKGIAILDKHLTANPSDAERVLKRARANMRVGAVHKALEDFARYIELRPADHAVRTEMADRLSRIRDKKTLQIALSVYDNQLATNPNNKNALLQRCRVHSLLGKTKQAVADGRAYVALAGRTMEAQLQVATILSWSKDKQALKMALRLLDAYIARYPDKLEVLLQKARVLSWYGDLPGSIAAYRTYLGKRVDDKAMLELANVLTWDGRRPALSQAVAQLSRYLARHPLDFDVLAKRGQLRYRLGRYRGALNDLRAYMKENPNDADRCLLLGRALAESGDLAAANSVLDVLLKKKRSLEARLLKAQVMRLRGEHSRAETALTRLVAETSKRPELQHAAQVELAQLYAATGRQVRALELLQRLSREAPQHALGLRVKKRIESGYRQPRVEPSFFAYRDNHENMLVKMGLHGAIHAHPRLKFFLDASAWRLAHERESLWTQRLDLGIKIQPTTFLEIEGAIGPRSYQVYATDFGARIGARARPLSWLEASAAYLYDDIYQMFYQPGSLSARARGHTCTMDVRLDLPYRIVATGEAIIRDVDPDNSEVDLSGGVVVPLFSIFSAGYYGRWLTWDDNDPSYWSPTAFNLHSALVRAIKEVPSIGLSVQIQGAIGVAAERIEGIGETGVRIAASGRADVSYRPASWIAVKAALDMGLWPRLKVVDFNGGTASPDGQTLRTKTSETYLWIAPSATVTITL